MLELIAIFSLIVIAALVYFPIRACLICSALKKEVEENKDEISSLKSKISILLIQIGELKNSSGKSRANCGDVKAENAAAQADYETNEKPAAEIAAAALPKAKPAMQFTEYKGISEEKQGRPFEAKKFFEEYVASKLFLWLGGLALIFAGFFLAKYSIEKGLLSPLMRVCATAVFSLLLFLFAEFFKRRSKIKEMPTILFAAAIAVLYGDLFAASVFYGLIPIQAGFWCAVVCSLAAFAAMKRYGDNMIYMAIFAAFLAPAIFNSGNPCMPSLVSYLFVATITMAAACVRKNAIAALAVLIAFNYFWEIAGASIVDIHGNIDDVLWYLSYITFISYLFYFVVSKLDFNALFDAFPRIFDAENPVPVNTLKWFAKNGILLASTAAIFLIFSDSRNTIAEKIPYAVLSMHAAFALVVFAAIRGDCAMRVFAVLFIPLVAVFMDCVAYSIFAFAVLTAMIAYLFAKESGVRFTSTYAFLFFTAISAIYNSYAANACYETIVTLSGLFGLLSIFAIAMKRAASNPDYESAYPPAILGANILLCLYAIQILPDIQSSVLFVGAIAFANMLAFRKLKIDSFALSIPATALSLAFIFVQENNTMPLLIVRNFVRDASMAQTSYLCAAALIAFSAFEIYKKFGKLGRWNEFWSGLSVAEFLFFQWLCTAYLAFELLFGHAGLFSCAKMENSVVSIYSSWGFSINAIACCAVSVFALIIGAYSQKRKMRGAEMSVLLAFAAIFLWSFSDGSFSTLAFKIYVPGWPILNMFVFSLLVPSIAMGYFALKICGGKTGRAVFGIGALILFFLFLNFQLRFCFQGNYLWGKTTEIESYAYSPLWLGFGLLLLFLCNKFEILRYVSLVAVMCAVTKVFLWDAANLDGILRVVSFALLGLALMATGYIYSRWIFKKNYVKT